jgi:hypothetical protein
LPLICSALPSSSSLFIVSLRFSHLQEAVRQP